MSLVLFNGLFTYLFTYLLMYLFVCLFMSGTLKWHSYVLASHPLLYNTNVTACNLSIYVLNVCQLNMFLALFLAVII